MRRTIALLRAATDARRSAARLAELGHAAVVAPVTEVRATGAAIPSGRYEAVVATSAKAFDLSSAAACEAIAGLALFVVGAQTARAAGARGLLAGAATRDAAALAETLRTRLAPGARVLYLAGRDRKSDLERGLAAAGCLVTPVEVYAAEARRAWSAEEARAVADSDAAMHYSTRGAELALRLAADAGIGGGFRAILHVCISEQAAARLQASGASNVRAASRPDEDALLDALAQALGAR